MHFIFFSYVMLLMGYSEISTSNVLLKNAAQMGLIYQNHVGVFFAVLS